jgi:hypothetical protein
MKRMTRMKGMKGGPSTATIFNQQHRQTETRMYYHVPTRTVSPDITIELCVYSTLEPPPIMIRLQRK